MRVFLYFVAVVISQLLASAHVVYAQEGRQYEASIIDASLPDGWFMGEVAGLEFDTRGHMYVFNRGHHPLLEFDKKGKFVRELGQGLFRVPHGLRIDAEGNIWTTDQETHQVLKFSRDGRVLLTLGRRDSAGTGWYDRGYQLTLLNAPSDVAWDRGGNIYVADGSNYRIVKFDVNGEFVGTWGHKGDKPGEFNFPHSIVVDEADRLYVTDRENKRVQIFNPEGELLDVWNIGANPYVIQLVGDAFWISDARAGEVLKLDRSGTLLGRYGQWGKEVGDFGFPHGFDLANDGHVYVGDLLNWRIQRLKIAKKK
ncbi:MAG: 6-bladed beta-propeller [Alphaproteobacteria bacterium]|nr:6-bladed beta-propeller [Alphaproteobacteria bacterium]